ncbi:class I SAM-dependent methyltransferase [Paenibacillus tritici]|jgi:16S rRNA (guanine1207-N2)-methyltransferase|uniref:Class I SAM-dependent methyltransferase n=1 Tax=Paenibacillus tritici TaxID=1873425 RepID=A0ABX2DXG1_9BACL|nr:class I SAM-dependent methyltransferase [Paenibacillus tritici]NQX49403.1 class I SAM-dependent methyltransferase [Paenibacillus tritici]QUL54437.1 class I SAM-dependent methyltransferase [Paenibacillus tritici]
MSQHYYSQQPEARHDRRSIDTELRGKSLRFTSDAGVFSKGDIDYGSRVLIEAMVIPDGAGVLDVGCGYGPIGISAAYLAPKGHVTMIDINSRAVELARENAQHNGIRNVTVMQSDVLSAVQGRKFDVILTNPPIRAGKAVVHQIFEQAYDHLHEGGSLWIVIQKKQGAPSAVAKLESLFPVVEEVGKDKGYRIIRAQK